MMAPLPSAGVDGMRTEFATSVNDWSISIWNLREAMLGTGREAALNLGEWQRALDLNAESLQSKIDRGAGGLEQARFRANDFGPLLELNRHDKASKLLQDCQKVFEQSNALAELGRVFSA